jgi:hypothetical protein
MKTIIAGSRSISQFQAAAIVNHVVGTLSWRPTLVLSGGAVGADRGGEEWARANGVPIERYLPDWKKHGRRAGLVRNGQMVAEAEALIAIWDGKSRGTKHTIDAATKKGIVVRVVVV